MKRVSRINCRTSRLFQEQVLKQLELTKEIMVKVILCDTDEEIVKISDEYAIDTFRSLYRKLRMVS